MNIHYRWWRENWFRPYGGSLFSRAKKVTKKALLLVWPSSLGCPHSGDAPWARRQPPSMAGGGSRGIHAARPTPRHLRSACTQVAIGVVCESRALSRFCPKGVGVGLPTICRGPAANPVNAPCLTRPRG
ncbi:hypothetical protein D3M70_17340 [Pseudomonas sp. LS-2]|nr:hypothetical protein D3M70_17340 [Pseudomonas sp. LS-2]